MKDRVPELGKANRVKITQDNGQIVEGVLSYADGATVQGSAYCKANVLPDAVCDALGVDRVTAEPKDALNKLKTLVDTAQAATNGRAKIATGSYIGNGTSGVGNPTVLSFPFIPQIIILHPRQTGDEASLTAIFIKDSTLAYPFTSNAYS